MNHWISSTYGHSSAGLGVFRILFALASLLVWPETPTHPLGGSPAEWWFAPLGPFLLLDAYPSTAFIRVTETLSGCALVFLLLGHRTRAAGLVFALTQWVLAGIRFSTGKIDHDVLLVVVPLVMSFTSWGETLSVDRHRASPERPRPEPATWQLSYLALFVGLTFFSAGFMKALTGWADPATSATRGYLFVYLHHYPWANHAFNHWLAGIEHAAFWKALDYGTLLFEMGFLPAVLRPQWFRLFLRLALVFHIGTVLLLGIDFSRLLLVYAAFVDFRFIADSRVARAMNAIFARIAVHPLAWATLLATGWVAATLRWGRPSLLALLGGPFPRHPGMWLLVVVLVVSLFTPAWRSFRSAAPEGIRS